MENTKKGYLLMLGFCLFAAISYLCVDAAFRIDLNLTPANGIFWGFLGTYIITSFGLISKTFRQNLKKELSMHGKLLAAISILTAVGALFWFWAMKESNSGILAFMEKSSILFVALLGIIFLQEKFYWREIPSLLILLIGFFLLIKLDGEITTLGSILILSNAFLYSLQSLFVKKWGGQIDARTFSILRGFFMLVILGIILGVLGLIQKISWYIFVLLTISQITGLVLGRIFYFEAHKFLPISKLNLITLLVPALVLLGNIVIFHDKIYPQKIIGMSLVLIGLLFFMREQVKLKQTIKIKNELSKTN